MMRKCAPLGVLAVAAAALLTGLTAGCATTEDQRMDARETAGSFRKSLVTAPSHIDATMNALYIATSGDVPNRSLRFNEFKEKLASLESDARNVGWHADKAKADADKYFKEWARDAVAADPSKREQMSAVMEGRQSNYQTALTYLNGGREQYRVLIANLNDIKRTLDANLASATSNEVEKKVNAAKIASIDVKDYIARLTDNIDATLAKK